MKRSRALLCPAVLALTLSACGGSSTVTAPSSTPSASASASTSATPSTSAVPSAAPTTCPLTAKEVPPPADATKDLAVKPVVKAGPKPPPEGPTGLTYSDIVVGTGPAVKVGSDAKLKYVGALYADGTEFDSSWKTSPTTTFDVKACFQGAIPGFSVGPIGMKVGGRRQINIPSVLGYDKTGSPPKIPADAALIFVVDLVSVTGP